MRSYRSELELLDYLRFADPVEERDISGAVQVGSLIHKMRPPFFPVFDQSAEVLASFGARVSMDQWALALFNLPRPERAKIDSHFSDKQRFLLVDRFKRFDTQPPTAEAIGQARERIGAQLAKFLTSNSNVTVLKTSDSNLKVDESKDEKLTVA